VGAFFALLDPLLAGVRREALADAMRRPEEDLLERLYGHRSHLRLEAIDGDHVAHGRADDPVKLAGFLGHRARTVAIIV